MESYHVTFTIDRLWKVLIITMLAMFSLLLFFGGEIYQKKPPIPGIVVSEAGVEVFDRDDIQRGQNIWQSLGGMQKGSIWGHGSYLAPDWSADWLHREAVSMLQVSAFDEFGANYDDLSASDQRVLEVGVRWDIRQNRWDPEADRLTISTDRLKAIGTVSTHYADVFQARDNENSRHLREQYAFSKSVTLDDEDMHALNAFIFWTSWSAVTERPGDIISCTSNWPYDPLVGNTPSASLLIWALLSIMLLLGGIGALVWFYAAQYDIWREDLAPAAGVSKDNLLAQATQTPSMRACAKYFWTVVALFGLQIVLGILVAHYAVEGQELYGFPIAEYLPYSVARTWHTHNWPYSGLQLRG